MRRLAAWSIGLVLTSGCADRGPDGTYPVVQNQRPSEDELLSAVEVRRIGRAEGAGPDLFGRVDFVGTDGLGRVFVGDGLEQTIQVFGPDGEFVRSVGREGEGPGEFSGMTGVTFDPEGNAWVWDPWAQRLSVFDSAGGLLRTEPREWGARILPWPGQFSTDGRLLDVTIRHDGLQPQDPTTRRFATSVIGVWHAPDLTPTDSTPALVTPRTAYGGNFSVPYEPALRFVFEPDGSSWSTQGSGYRVVHIGASGDTLLSFTLDEPPVPVTAAELDSVLASQRLPRSIPRMEADIIPKTKPAVAQLTRVGPGSIGVFPELPSQTGRYMDVFNEAGEHQARLDLGVMLQLRPTAPVVRDGFLYGVTKDELDVPYVVVISLPVSPTTN